MVGFQQLTPALPESATPPSTGDLGLTGGICHRFSLQAFKQSSFCWLSFLYLWDMASLSSFSIAQQRECASSSVLNLPLTTGKANLNLLAFECGGLECCTSTDVGIQ